MRSAKGYIQILASKTENNVENHSALNKENVYSVLLTATSSTSVRAKRVYDTRESISSSLVYQEIGELEKDVPKRGNIDRLIFHSHQKLVLKQIKSEIGSKHVSLSSMKFARLRILKKAVEMEPNGF